MVPKDLREKNYYLPYNLGQLIGKLNERTPKILSAEGKKYDFQKRKEEGCVQSKIKLLITILIPSMLGSGHKSRLSTTKS